jgi:cytochrome P450
MLNNELFAALLTALLAGQPTPHQPTCNGLRQAPSSVAQRQALRQNPLRRLPAIQPERLARVYKYGAC